MAIMFEDGKNKILEQWNFIIDDSTDKEMIMRFVLTLGKKGNYDNQHIMLLFFKHLFKIENDIIETKQSNKKIVEQNETLLEQNNQIIELLQKIADK